MRRAPGGAIVEHMVTPKRVVEITPLVVAQIEYRERLSRERAAADQDAKRDRRTTSQKLGRS
jgi:hypothetical protein